MEGIRYEFHHGEVFAVAGGSISHARISSNSFFELESALRSNHADCETFTSEAKLEISPAGRYVYPDTLVICGDVIESKEVVGSITNPRLVIEVISKSSEDYDRGIKFDWYRKLPTLREYLIIEQDQPKVNLRRRYEEFNIFQYIDVEGLDQSIELTSLGITLRLAELYKRIHFPA